MRMKADRKAFLSLTVALILLSGCGNKADEDNKAVEDNGERRKTDKEVVDDRMLSNLKGPVRRAKVSVKQEMTDKERSSASQTSVKVYEFDRDGNLIYMDLNGTRVNGDGSVYKGEGYTTVLKRDKNGRISGYVINKENDEIKITEEYIYAWQNGRVASARRKYDKSLEGYVFQNEESTFIYGYNPEGERTGLENTFTGTFGNHSLEFKTESKWETLEKDRYGNMVRYVDKTYDYSPGQEAGKLLSTENITCEIEYWE